MLMLLSAPSSTGPLMLKMPPLATLTVEAALTFRPLALTVALFRTISVAPAAIFRPFAVTTTGPGGELASCCTYVVERTCNPDTVSDRSMTVAVMVILPNCCAA